MKINFFFLLPLFSSFLAPCISQAAPAPRTLPPVTQRQIEALLRHPGLRSAHVGISIVALGEVSSPQDFPSKPYDDHLQPQIFGRDEGKSFIPASNMKLFTAAWVLKRLGPDKTFSTSVLRFVTRQSIVGDGLVVPLSPTQIEEAKKTAPLFLVGGGDPSLSTSDLDDLAEQVAAKGVQSAGKIYGDGSLFGAENTGGRYPDGWTLDDTLWYYGPPISALSINRNQFDVTLKGTTSGSDATIILNPEPPLSVTSFVRTVAPGTLGANRLEFKIDNFAFEAQPQLSVSGVVEPQKTLSEGLAVPNPEWWAASLFKAALQKKSISTGSEDKAPFVSNKMRKSGELVATHESPPVRTLLQKFLKSSDNLYGELLLRAAALQLPTSDKQKGQSALAGNLLTIASTGLAGSAHSDLVVWLKEQGIPLEGLRFSDGSGLSRYNLLTPYAVSQLLRASEHLPAGNVFYQAFPIAGVDGTLKNRMVSSLAEGNVRAKTGTFSIVNCLSGYVTTSDGHRLAVSILTNFVSDGELARRWQGRVFATLAAASWKPVTR